MWKQSWGTTWRTCPNATYALEASLVWVQGSLTLHCNINMWYCSACHLSGHCNQNRIQYCHSTILQLWKFRVVQWSVTNPNPLGLTINQALVSLWLAVVADVTSCKKVRFGLVLKENTNHFFFKSWLLDVIYNLEDTIDFSMQPHLKTCFFLFNGFDFFGCEQFPVWARQSRGSAESSVWICFVTYDEILHAVEHVRYVLPLCSSPTYVFLSTKVWTQVVSNLTKNTQGFTVGGMWGKTGEMLGTSIAGFKYLLCFETRAPLFLFSSFLLT